MTMRNVAPLVGPGVAYAAVGTAAEQVLGQNLGRVYLRIQAGATALNVMLGSSTAPALTIAANEAWEPLVPPGDAVWISVASGTGAATVWEA